MTRSQPHSHGFSLIEIMVAMSVLSITIYAIMELEITNAKAMLFSQITLSRDSVALNLRRAILSGSTLNESLATNVDFNNCVTGAVPNGCTEGTSYDLRLSNSTSPNPLSGPPGSPIYYDSRGSFCTTPGAANCPLAVTTTFNATCPLGSPSPCTRAETITVSYTIQENASGLKQYLGTLRTTTGTVSRSAQDILNSTVSCPDGQYVAGFGADGSILCKP